MINKLLNIFVIITLLFTFVIFIIAAYNIILLNVDYEENYMLGTFTYLLVVIIVFVFSTRIKYINVKLQMVVLLYFFSALVLGELLDFYLYFPLWDNFLHILFGIIMTLVLLDIIKNYNKSNLFIKYNIVLVLLFVFFCTISIGVFWEFFEFFMDTFFNYNMQKSVYINSVSDYSIYFDEYGRMVSPALLDTMTDLFLESLFSFLTCTTFFIYYYFNKIKRKKT